MKLSLRSLMFAAVLGLGSGFGMTGSATAFTSCSMACSPVKNWCVAQGYSSCPQFNACVDECTRDRMSPI